jgi:hypothetical protein
MRRGIAAMQVRNKSIFGFLSGVNISSGLFKFCVFVIINGLFEGKKITFC